MGTSYGAVNCASLYEKCVLHAPLTGSATVTTAKTITANGNQKKMPIIMWMREHYG